MLACATDETKLSTGFFQDLRTLYDWTFKKAIVDLLIKMKGNFKRTSSNSLSPLRSKNKDIGTTSQTFVKRLNFVCDAGSTVVRFTYKG